MGLCSNNDKDIERLDNNGDYNIRNYQIMKGKTACILSIIFIFNKHVMLHIRVAYTDECLRYCIIFILIHLILVFQLYPQLYTFIIILKDLQDSTVLYMPTIVKQHSAVILFPASTPLC